MLPVALSGYVLLLVKGFFILASVFYIIFAAVVLRQVFLMSKNVQDIHNSIIFVLSIIHLIGSLVLLLFCIQSIENTKQTISFLLPKRKFRKYLRRYYC